MTLAAIVVTFSVDSLAGLAGDQIDHWIVNRESWIVGFKIEGLVQIWTGIVDRDHDPRP